MNIKLLHIIVIPLLLLKYICFDPPSSVSMADHSSLTAVNIVYDPQGPALICKSCQYALAVSKSQATSNLWEKHRICPESRRDISPLISSLDIPNPIDIRCRPDGVLARPHLEVYCGYACLSCKHRTINLPPSPRIIYTSSESRWPLSRRATSDLGNWIFT